MNIPCTTLPKHSARELTPHESVGTMEQRLSSHSEAQPGAAGSGMVSRHLCRAGV